MSFLAALGSMASGLLGSVGGDLLNRGYNWAKDKISSWWNGSSGSTTGVQTAAQNLLNNALGSTFGGIKKFADGFAASSKMPIGGLISSAIKGYEGGGLQGLGRAALGSVGGMLKERLSGMYNNFVNPVSNQSQDGIERLNQ